jgi:ABC-2 type transport system ATP-binding protein
MIGGMGTPVFHLAGIRKSFGRTEALAGVGLSVEPGELFGLLGPNGAGKTTLLSILAGLTGATSGEVKLFGEPFDPTSREARKSIGLATQDLAIYPELSARENLRFFGQLYGMGGADLAIRIGEMLEAVSLTERADQRAGTFSGGMKRRLNLAVALVHRPKVLLLDEPTTGVDPQSRNHIFERVRAFNAAGLTVIYTSHYMEEVQALCPRIGILDGGRMIACDTRENLLGRLATAVTLTLDRQSDDWLSRVRALAGVTTAEWIDGDLRVMTPDAAKLLPALLVLGVTPLGIDVKPPNLESVFLSLTGRALRD